LKRFRQTVIAAAQEGHSMLDAIQMPLTTFGHPGISRRRFLGSVAAATIPGLASRARAGEGTATRRVLPPYTKPTLIAHRGASGEAPEHTLAAYELALKHGADFVEPDLQLTKDGVLVCLHDLSLERTTDVAKIFPDRSVEVKGRKVWPVVSFTVTEIQRLDAGSWKDSKFAGARIPTFQQMIDLVKGKAGIIPETKAPETYGAHGMNMEKALMEVLRSNKLDTPQTDSKTQVVIQSFSAASLKALRFDHGCKLPLIFLFSSDEYAGDKLSSIKSFADGIAPSKSIVTAHPEIISEAHKLGMSVTVWTFRAGQTDPFKTVREEMDHFLNKLHVDAVFTDNPDQFPRAVGGED
jgi:glycerophosphoryl diester phosphodiesterase